jgi:hypothetical protein
MLGIVLTGILALKKYKFESAPSHHPVGRGDPFKVKVAHGTYPTSASAPPRSQYPGRTANSEAIEDFIHFALKDSVHT